MVGDSCLIPAGTVHSIGAGLVIAEIQQRADVTFRLFDHNHGRELNLEDGVAASNCGLPPRLFEQCRLSETRCLLAASPYFVLERLDLPANTTWRLDAQCETWLLALEGDGIAGELNLSVGDAIFGEADHVDLGVGGEGLVALATYARCGPSPMLLRQLTGNGRVDPADARQEREIAYFARALAAYSRLRQEILAMTPNGSRGVHRQ